MDSTMTQVRLPRSLTRRYDQLAEGTGRGREELLIEALEEYLARIADAGRSEPVDADVVHAEAEALLIERGVSREQLAAIRAEVFAQMEEAYGVSLCE